MTKNKLTIALLSGGNSSERMVSLKSGDEVYRHLDPEKYSVIRYDPKTDLSQLIDDADKIDMALIIMHGPNGEDGTIQGLLDLLNIPYQGSGVLASALSMDKYMSKKMYTMAGLPVPNFEMLYHNQSFDIQSFIEKLHFPIVIKPAKSGSSIGMSIVDNPLDLSKGIEDAFRYDKTILLEEYITGIEITGGVIGNDTLDALPIVEIVPNPQYQFFNYEAKYQQGATQEICPARIDNSMTKRAKEYAILAHQTLGCRGYSRTDMIIQDNQIYVLETNTIPGMTTTSLLPQAANVFGLSFPKLLDRLIELGLQNQS